MVRRRGRQTVGRRRITCGFNAQAVGSGAALGRRQGTRLIATVAKERDVRVRAVGRRDREGHGARGGRRRKDRRGLLRRGRRGRLMRRVHGHGVADLGGRRGAASGRRDLPSRGVHLERGDRRLTAEGGAELFHHLRRGR